MYLLSPKVKRLGTKGSENSENVFEIQLKIIIEINYGKAVAFLRKYQHEGVCCETRSLF